MYHLPFSDGNTTQIPQVIREATFVLVDKRTKNFQILFDDKDEITKIIKIVFNKDEFGNYIVTVGKVDRRDGISEKENMVIGVGVAPTISALRFPEELPATRLRPSPITYNENITQKHEKSTEENLFPEEQEIRNAQGKLGDIVREVFLKLSDEEIESGTTADEKYSRYQKWYEPMVNELYHLPFSDGNTTENSIYVGSENNEDGRKPELVNFHYFAAGININNNDFTAKVVFTENNKGEFYYDQSLSTIEKGRFVDILQEKNKLETSSPQKKAEDSFELLKDANAPFEYYDKRLINICQVPQMPYLNKELLPTKETIESVRNGQLKIEKSGQTYSMVDLRNTENAVESSLENYKTRHQKKWLEFEDNRKNSVVSPSVFGW